MGHQVFDGSHSRFYYFEGKDWVTIMAQARMLVSIDFEPYNGCRKRLRKGESYTIARTAYQQLPDPKDQFRSLDGDSVGVWVAFTWTENSKKDSKDVQVEWLCYVKVLYSEFE